MRRSSAVLVIAALSSGEVACARAMPFHKKAGTINKIIFLHLDLVLDFRAGRFMCRKWRRYWPGAIFSLR
jgi:hypothetical protein